MELSLSLSPTLSLSKHEITPPDSRTPQQTHITISAIHLCFLETPRSSARDEDPKFHKSSKTKTFDLSTEEAIQINPNVAARADPPSTPYETAHVLFAIEPIAADPYNPADDSVGEAPGPCLATPREHLADTMHCSRIDMDHLRGTGHQRSLG